MHRHWNRLHASSRRFVLLWAILGVLASCSGASSAAHPRALPNPFHVFHFCMAQLSPARQAELAHDVGYDGIAYLGSGDGRILEEIADYQRHPVVPLAALFWSATFDAPEPFDAALVKEVARKLEGTDTLLWLSIRSQRAAPDVPDEASEALAAGMIQRFADIARRHHVVVALYPHDGEYLATAEHALRLIQRANRDSARDNLKLSLHLCHELRAGNASRLAEIIQATLPFLAVVSISGANHAVTPGSPDWSDTIQVLGEGDYDVQGFVSSLVKAGYRGPIVLHTYGLQGDPRDLLTRSFQAWETLSQAAARAARD